MTSSPLPVAILLFGCTPGGCDGVDSSKDTSMSTSSSDCRDFEGAMMTAEQVSATPRADPLAEGTVLCGVGGPVVIDETLYARVAADFETILDTIDEYDRVWGFEDLPSFSWRYQFPQTLTLLVDDDTLSQLQVGEYHEWDCLNHWYEVEASDDYSSAYIDLSFDGVYDPRYLIDEYAALPGVSEVYIDESATKVGYLTGMRMLVDGDTVYYSYAARGGDCYEGCTEYLGLYFISTTAGEVELAGAIVDSDRESTSSAPDWAFDLPECAG